MGVGDAEFDAMDRGFLRRPLVRMGAIGEGWELFKQRWGVWVLAALVVLACNSAISGFIFSLFHLPRPAGPGGFRSPIPPEAQAIQTALSAVINGFFLGGMFRMACRQIRGQVIGLGTLFSVTDVLVNLALGSLLYILASSLGFFFCVIPGFIVSGVLMFTIPLIVDAGLRPTEAISRSWDALKDQWLSATLFHLVAWIVAGVGSCACCVGILVTAPLYSLSIAVLYRDFFMNQVPLSTEKPAPPHDDF